MNHLSPSLGKQMGHNTKATSLGLPDLRHWKLFLQITVLPNLKDSPGQPVK